jgi:2-methylcitrate dehydratase PrpD
LLVGRTLTSLERLLGSGVNWSFRPIADTRRKVVATVDDAIDEAAADVTAILHDGRRVHVRVEHAIGSLERPLSDAGLAAKFTDQSDPILGTSRTAALIVACRRLSELADVREVCRLGAVSA